MTLAGDRFRIFSLRRKNDVVGTGGCFVGAGATKHQRATIAIVASLRRIGIMIGELVRIF
jgi:hypothetical protein